jgi:hypothetical protein
MMMWKIHLLCVAQWFLIASNLLLLKAAPLLITCPDALVLAVNRTRGATNTEMQFCRHSTSTTGYGVIPGKSWGSLSQVAGKSTKEAFTRLGCALRDVGIDPSCDEERGDAFVQRWRSNPVQTGCPGSSGSTGGAAERTTLSKIDCLGSPTNNLLCSLEGAKLNFRQMTVQQVAAAGAKDIFRNTRNFSRGFISLDCNWRQEGTYVDPPETRAPGRSSPFRRDVVRTMAPVTDFEVPDESLKCDEEIADTVVLFSPDLIHNLAHTMNDYLNVMMTVWVANLTMTLRSNVSLMVVDSINFGGEMTGDRSQFGFYAHFANSFHRVLRASDYIDKVVCLKSKLVLPPESALNLYWEGKLYDLACSHVGPSSLLQRWNLHTRWSYGLLDAPSSRSAQRINVLLMVREGGVAETNKDIWRRFTPPMLAEFAGQLQGIPGVALTVIDMGTISYTEQLRLVADASILVGYHGAAIAHGLHMSIGRPFCCAVVEGYHRKHWMASYRFNGNALRSMGVEYVRIDAGAQAGFVALAVEAVRDISRAMVGGGRTTRQQQVQAAKADAAALAAIPAEDRAAAAAAGPKLPRLPKGAVKGGALRVREARPHLRVSVRDFRNKPHGAKSAARGAPRRLAADLAVDSDFGSDSGIGTAEAEAEMRARAGSVQRVPYALQTGRRFASCVLPVVLADPLMQTQQQRDWRPRNHSIYLI